VRYELNLYVQIRLIVVLCPPTNRTYCLLSSGPKHARVRVFNRDGKSSA